jgi:hypothetical protein
LTKLIEVRHLVDTVTRQESWLIKMANYANSIVKFILVIRSYTNLDDTPLLSNEDVITVA